jgi:DNA-binding SARP family transcriptional activator
VVDDVRRGGVTAGDARAAVLAAVPADDLPDFARHPVAAARAAVAPRLARSGHPAGPEVLAGLAKEDDATVRRAAEAALEDLRMRPLPLRFTLFGGFALARGRWPVDDKAWTRPTAARLVRYLLVQGGPVDEDRVAHDLWPEHDGEGARGALRMAVSRARQVIGPSALTYRDRTYRLELSAHDEVDAYRYRAEAQAALDAPGPQRRLLLARAEERFTGEPLPEERYADWAQPYRDELLSLRRRVLHALAAEHRRAGDEHAVAATACRLLAADALDEQAHRLLITALSRSGLRSLALRQYLECRRRLIDGAGLEPDAETAALQRRLLAGLPV